VQTRRLLISYPVLLRLWSRHVENWSVFLRDFLSHAEGFIITEAGLRRGRYEGVIRGVEAMLSDPHNGNRSVIAVHLRGGATWYYKPRSGRHERGWFQLLTWLNDQGFPAPFRIVEVISKERHSWMRKVRAQSIRSRHAAASYHFRAGALLYLVHILRGVDFHAGNVIASGVQPVMVDCETLLHARTRIPNAARMSARDILRTGMLPLSIGGLAREEPSALGRLEKGAHRLTIHGEVVPAAKYVDTIENGFLTMHRFLHRSTRMRSSFDRKIQQFFPRTGRRIYRPTAHYIEMLNRSYGVGTMIDGLYRSLFLHALCRDSATPVACVQHEVEALEDGDIPFFHGSTSTPSSPPSASQVRHSLLMLREQFQ
jgi:lantibiotic modifying enzyme